MEIGVRDIKFKPAVVDNVIVFKDERGSVYMTKYDDKNGLHVYDVLNNQIVEDPKPYQKMYGLLNYLSYDNSTNPAKVGYYRLNAETLFYNFLDDITSIKYGQIKSEKVLAHRWAMKDDNKLFNLAVKDLMKVVKQKDEELSM